MGHRGMYRNLKKNPIFISSKGIVISKNCSETDCPVKEVAECVNKDFEGVPEHLTFRHQNSSEFDFPYNITTGNNQVKEYRGKVGELLNFVCKEPKKVFFTEVPEWKDNVLTVVCKPDSYYTVPASGVRIKNFNDFHKIDEINEIMKLISH